MLVVYGEAPGADEDASGVPFIGRAGEVLDDALRMADIPRERVWISNVVRCRPPNNRTPRTDEIAACLTTWGWGDIEKLKTIPHVLVGETAIRAIGGLTGGVRANLGRTWVNPHGVTCWATWHPAAVLRGMGRTDQIADTLARALGRWISAKVTTGEERTIAVDTETDGLDFYRGRRPFLASLCDGKRGIIYDLESGLDRWRLQREIDAADQVVMHNALFDCGMLRRVGVQVPLEKVHDTRWSAALTDSGLCPYPLERLGDHFFGRGAVEKKRMREWLRDRGSTLKNGYKNIPRDVLEPYALEDAVLTWALFRHPALVQARATWHTAYAREQSLVGVLQRIEDRGMAVDLERLPDVLRSIEIERDLVLRDIRRAWAWPTFNPSSTKDVEILCDSLAIESDERTKTGNRSWSKGVLSRHPHPAAQEILQYRALRSLASGALTHFGDVLDRDGLLHPSFDSVGCETGRFTGKTRADDDDEKINLMGLPKIPAVRALIRARSGYTLIVADLKQIEQRGLAHYSNDENLVRAYNKNPEIDFYRLAGRLVYGREITDDERKLMKAVVLARGYGAGTGKIAKMLRRPFEWTAEFLTTFDQTMPGLGLFFIRVAQELRTTGRVVAEDWPSRLDWRVAYQGVNRIDQGGCAVQWKRRLITLDEIMHGEDAHILHHVHDELVAEVPINRVDWWVGQIRDGITSDWNWRVPVVASISTGPNWGETTAI